MRKMKLTQGPVVSYTSRRERRKCCLDLLKRPVLRPSTALGGITMILGPADASVDPNEKDEDKEIAMRSKIIALQAGHCATGVETGGVR